MACDSCWNHNRIQTSSLTKIQRLSSGALYGGAGDGDDRTLVALLDKARTYERLPPREDLADIAGDFDSLLVFPNGTMVMLTKNSEDTQVWLANRGVAAIGSGRDLAIGAMAAGKSAREAVAIACAWDMNSRLPVHTLELRKAK